MYTFQHSFEGQMQGFYHKSFVSVSCIWTCHKPGVQENLLLINRFSNRISFQECQTLTKRSHGQQIAAPAPKGVLSPSSPRYFTCAANFKLKEQNILPANVFTWYFTSIFAPMLVPMARSGAFGYIWCRWLMILRKSSVQPALYSWFDCNRREISYTRSYIELFIAFPIKGNSYFTNKISFINQWAGICTGVVKEW